VEAFIDSSECVVFVVVVGVCLGFGVREGFFMQGVFVPVQGVLSGALADINSKFG
jgi:hypothetical protein